MILNQWYVILASKEIKKNQVLGVKRLGENIVVWRDNQGNPGAAWDKCPHRGVALSLGEIKTDCIQCPFHGFEYDTGGACKLVPANGRKAQPPKALKVRSYATREAHGLVYIWWGDEQETYPALPYFESLDDKFVYSTVRDHWNTHYSRAIENQLDVVHLPFVHRTTIGAGNKTVVNGPQVKVKSHYPQDNLLELWVANEVDSGQTPRKAAEMPEPARRPFLQFRYPNVWHNWISESIRVFVAFAPIDHENTMMYLRYYHTVKTPVLRQLTGFLGGIANLVIERQDKRVVITQQPKRADLEIGEVLIQGDGPIITYRKIRRALIEGKETGAEQSP